MNVTLDNIDFSYKDELILKGLSAIISDDDKIGLIGENGAGKTTLIKLIMGELKPDSGSVFKKKNLTIGYLVQNSGLDSTLTVMEEMKTCFFDLIKMEERMHELENEMGDSKLTERQFNGISSEYNWLKKNFESLDGYNIEVKIKTVLSGLGFLNMYDRIINSFSGGEKTRLSIAKLLLQNPELLILDEPTNHLDFQTLNWLEEYLRTYKGALLIVSHDRFFLDKAVTKIWELENNGINAFKGNYTKYKALKQEWVLSTMKEYEKQQVEIAKMEDFVAKNLARATTAKSAQSRVKKLESMERIEKPRTTRKAPTFKFDKGINPTKEIVRASQLTLFAGEKKLFENANFFVARGEKAAIVGNNGTGKSTLLKKIISSFSKEDCESFKFGQNILLSYYDQENLNLNFDNTVLLEMWDKFPKSDMFKIRQSLGRMLFGEDDLDKKISVLSGGERARLGFSIMMMKEGNFLVMDEPTNHIDLMTRESLEDALIEYDGSLLFVSHDRYFLKRLATKIIEIKDFAISTYEMDFDAYLEESKAKEQSIEKQANELKEKAKDDYKSLKVRKESAKKRLRLKEVHEQILLLEKELDHMNENILTEKFQKDFVIMNKELSAISQCEEKLKALFSEWEELEE